jgi:ABC-2 type transport system permease protein
LVRTSGLALLGGVFCSVGMVASSITANQIVAFILAAFLCFILFSGFESIASFKCMVGLHALVH